MSIWFLVTFFVNFWGGCIFSSYFSNSKKTDTLEGTYYFKNASKHFQRTWVNEFESKGNKNLHLNSQPIGNVHCNVKVTINSRMQFIFLYTVFFYNEPTSKSTKHVGWQDPSFEQFSFFLSINLGTGRDKDLTMAR